MIGFFPDPYPDELLYSVCARYHQRAGYRANSYTARDLFGANVAAAIVLQGRLNHLIAVLPPGHRYSVNQLIDQHTLLPFYAPFLPPERVSRLRSLMAEEGRGNSVYWQAGTILRAKIHLECLRYCPECLAEDRRQYGEAYWHRVHQVPGVLVCPHHAVQLKPSSLYAYIRGQHRKFWKRIDQVMQDIPTPLQKVEERDHQAHLWIAQEVWWLLNHHPSPNSPENLRGRYHGLLLSRSLANYTGVVRIRKLQEEFRNFYSEELLKELHSQLDIPGNWLARLVQSLQSAQHPIRHLLLMRFLGCSAAEFFQLSFRPQPFGAGPWLCLNPVCRHYQQPSIEKFEIRRLQVGLYGKKKAADFRCACGFTYSRPLPDSTSRSDADSYQVKSCGSIWEETLRQLYSSGNYTHKELAQKLGVPLLMIKYKIKRLKQGQQTLDNHESAKQARAEARGEARRIAQELKRESYRKQWLQAMKENPAAIKSQLISLKPSAYYWLDRHDQEWLDTVSPPRSAKSSPPSPIDWKQRDRKLASAAQAAAERLKQSPGLPFRVSKHALAQEIGVVAVIYQRPHLLPETIAVLEEVSEGVNDMAVRRIKWAAESLREENWIPTSFWQVLARANVQWKVISRAPIVRAALRNVMREFGISARKLDAPE